MALPRHRREECPAVKHDTCFSRWKVLVGYADWESISTAKYRIHNLPSVSGPGVYELGITIQQPWRRVSAKKAIKNKQVAVVYLGHADNVRQRLQSYGHGGSHLEGRCAAAKCGPRLFSQAFERGYSIVFRWASTSSKKLAQSAEAQLLSVFDYAWNKGCNGARRSLDSLHKMQQEQKQQQKQKQRSFCTLVVVSSRTSTIAGVTVALSKPPAEKQDSTSSWGSKIWELLASCCCLDPGTVKRAANGNVVCGVITSEGIRCRKTANRGRKRCDAHRGMRKDAVKL